MLNQHPQSWKFTDLHMPEGKASVVAYCFQPRRFSPPPPALGPREPRREWERQSPQIPAAPGNQIVHEKPQAVFPS